MSPLLDWVISIQTHNHAESAYCVFFIFRSQISYENGYLEPYSITTVLKIAYMYSLDWTGYVLLELASVNEKLLKHF